MPFTVTEFHDLVRLVEERPEWRAELRRIVLTDELLALPEQVASLRRDTEQRFQQLAVQLAGLTTAQVRTEARLAELSQAQARTEGRLAELAAAQARLEEQMVTLSQAQARTEERLAELTAAQARLEEQMVTLSQAQARTEGRLAELAAAQARLEEQMVTLSQAQARTEERLAELTAAQTRTEEGLRSLVNWQRGEAGRRDGERYERDTLRRAPALFNGGQGGAPDHPDIQRRLAVQLAPLLAGDVLDAESDPFLADLVWWKGEQMAVVEVSVQVDRQDVIRAERRAATLRRSGAQARALVVGEQWATPEARELARTRQVAWKVGEDLSEDFLAFRRR
jgi:predicted nuclease with TOPRIM domain